MGYLIVSIQAQSCLPEGITFQTQAQIDSFPSMYPGCTHVLGDLTIHESISGNITHLDSLKQIRIVGGSVLIQYNDALTSLTGLDSLTEIGWYIGITGNDQLLNLDPLIGLTDLGALGVFSNDSLQSISGLMNIGPALYSIDIDHNPSLLSLNGLQGVDSLGFTLSISNANALQDLEGLDNLRKIMGALFIGPTTSLNSLQGLESLEHVELNFSIGTTDIQNLQGLDALEYVGGKFSIHNCPSLTSLNHLTTLTHVGEIEMGNNASLSLLGNAFLQIEIVNGPVWITSCHGLSNLSGLDSLQYIGGSLSISSNNGLTSLAGLNRLDSIGGSLSLYNLPQLENCLGLDRLKRIGGTLSLNSFNHLTQFSSLSGLEQLERVGSMVISDIEAPFTLNGLNGLKRVDDFLNIVNCGALASLDGLDSLEVIGSSLWLGNGYSFLTIDLPGLDTIHQNITIENMNSLEGIGGFESLKYIGGNIKFKSGGQTLSGFNQLSRVDGNVQIYDQYWMDTIAGFASLTEIGGYLEIKNNSDLDALNAFYSLTSIGGSLTIENSGTFDSITNFQELTEISGQLRIAAMPQLVSLAGLDSLDASSITNLFIASCPQLSFCSVESICTYIDNAGPVTIAGNALGCNSNAEIAFVCDPMLAPCLSLTSPVNGQSQVSLDAPLHWVLNPPITLGYILDAGTTPGGNDILDSVDVGNTNYFQSLSLWPSDGWVHVTITPYNSVGQTAGCPSDSFYTVNQATWIGTSGDWDVASNWDIAGIPGPETRVIIPSGSVRIPPAYTAVASSILVSDSASLIIDTAGTFVIDNPGAQNAFQISTYATVHNKGQIIIGVDTVVLNHGLLTESGGTFINDTTGLLTINHIENNNFSALVVNGNAAVIENFGLIQLGIIGTLPGAGLKLNGGTFINRPGAEVRIDSAQTGISLAGLIINHGFINIGVGGSISTHGVMVVNSATFRNESDGDLSIQHALTGIQLNGSANFINAGLVDIGSAGMPSLAQGIVTNAGASCTNDSSGYIRLNHLHTAWSQSGFFNYTFNRGLIEIGQIAPCAQGMFVFNSSVFENDTTGHLVIDQITTMDGIQVYGSNAKFNNSGHVAIGATATIQRYGLYLYSTGDLWNKSGGTMSIDRCLSHGLIQNGSGSVADNFGELRMGQFGPISTVGLELAASSAFSNRTDGLLTIDRVSGYSAVSILGSASLTNFGEIYIGDDHAIPGGVISWGNAKLYNKPGGIIGINRATWVALLIDNSGTLTDNEGIFNIGHLHAVQNGISCGNGGDYLNRVTGSIQIESVVDVAIRTSTSGSIFNNHGNIQIGNTGNIGGAGILAEATSTFRNELTGTIDINRLNINWWSKAIGVYNSANVLNFGSMEIGHLSLNSIAIIAGTQGKFTNSGQIAVSQTTYNGIELADAGTTFTNSGQIALGHAAPLGLHGVRVTHQALFTNQATGVIKANNAGPDWWKNGLLIHEQGSFFNSGTIHVGDSIPNSNGVAVETGGFFRNETTGQILVFKNSFRAISCIHANSGFENKGILNIGLGTTAMEHGIHIAESGSFTNAATGLITINKTNLHWWTRAIGIYVSSTFTNAGQIMAGETSPLSLGIHIEGGSTLTNVASGSITINQATYQAIQLLQSGTSCLNHGTITIGNLFPIGEYGIGLWENSTMTNSATGSIDLNGGDSFSYSSGLRINASTFTNNGRIRTGSLTSMRQGIHLTTNGILTNSGGGVIECNHGTTSGTSAGIFIEKGQLTNEDTIRAGSLTPVNIPIRVGLNASSTGDLSNEGIIEIDRVPNTTFGSAINVNTSSTFTNATTGIVKMGINHPVAFGLYGGGTISNYGLMQMRNVDFGFVDLFQTVTNYSGSVMEVLPGGTMVIEALSTLHHQAGAALRSLPGAYIRIKGTVNNQGLIEAQ